MDPITLTILLPVFPLAAFFIIVLFTNRSKLLSTIVAVGAMLLSFLAAVIVVSQSIRIEHFAEHPLESSLQWFPLSGEVLNTGVLIKYLNIGILVDPLTVIVLSFASITMLMIFIYSIGYQNFGAPEGDHDKAGLPPHGATVSDDEGHSHKVPSIEPMYSRFFAFLALFAAGMLLLVVSDNLLVLFVGWEIMGLCSYLLIGFWYARPSARAAAVKAFMTTRVGDMFMLLGIVYLYSTSGTLNFKVLFTEPVLESLAVTPTGVLGLSAAGLIGLLLFIGTIGKSAQFPLHTWLPDAMEGPTPVSAMIHAAAMVSAGVYMIIRMFPLMEAGSPEGMTLSPLNAMILIGGFTALFAAVIAVAQRDIKRVLAYSTISQLGYMVAALGTGGFIAAAFHLFTHAFFKALLFLGSGSVIHGVEHGVLHTDDQVDPQDMFNMGGLRKKMPITFWTFLLGGLALAGFPLGTAGFWSKDEILAETFAEHHTLLFWTLAIAAFITAFYTMRQITLTFLGKPRSEAADHAHESRLLMTAPLVVLAFFAVTIGWLGIPTNFLTLSLPTGQFQDFLHGLVDVHHIEFNPIPIIVSIGVSLGGLALGWLVYRNVEAGEEDPLARWLGFFYTWMENKFYVDELYDFVFVRPAYWIARQFTYLFLDRRVIDGILHGVASIFPRIGGFLRRWVDLPIINGFGDFVGESTKWFGRSFRVIQTGRIQDYLSWMLLAVAALAILFIYLLVFLPS